MSLYITSYFQDSRDKLDKQYWRFIWPTIQMMESNPKADSLQMHRVNKVKCDQDFWSVRVTQDIRIIFYQKGNDKKFLYIDHHDAAYNWCEGKYYQLTKFGAECIVDTKLQSSVADAFVPEQDIFSCSAAPILSSQDIKAKDLVKLGIPELHAENLLKISDDDQYLEYITIFPSEISEALLSIAGGKPFDHVLNELTDREFESGQTSCHKDTQRRFYMLQSLDELEALLNSDDFEAWTLFLHPEQEKLVRMNFNGPALIEGGPGTGKTIVGIHRAVYLSQHVFRPEDGKKILFCTFSKKLAKNIENKLDLLLAQKGLDRKNIDVDTADAYIFKLYKSAHGVFPAVSVQQIRSLMRSMYESYGSTTSFNFYEYEYREVIEKNNITSLEEYLAADRSGGGKIPLNEKQRRKAWEFLGAFLEEKHRRHLLSYVDVAHEVRKAMTAGNVRKEYDAIVIDEAQDLEPVKIRVLADSTVSDTNNVFILSDSNQRIFTLSSWKRDSGVDVVGKAKYLFINYRTTKQISDYARLQFMQSEMTPDHIREYKSIINGIQPRVEGFPSESAQRKYIVREIQEMDNCPAEQICVICAGENDCISMHTALEDSDIISTILKDDLLPGYDTGINICSINGVKGLEFRVVIIYNYDKIGSYISKYQGSTEITDSYVKQIECQKYVAATRARDELIITFTEES